MEPHGAHLVFIKAKSGTKASYHCEARRKPEREPKTISQKNTRRSI